MRSPTRRGRVLLAGGVLAAGLLAGAAAWHGAAGPQAAEGTAKGPVRSGAPGAGPGGPAEDRPTAARRYGWGRPLAADDFGGTALDPLDWEVYAGRSADGRRDPRQVRVGGGVLTITGRPDGTTGGVAWMRGAQRRGRWEARIKVGRACACYNANLLLWPVNGGGGRAPKGGGGEIDYMETYGDSGLREGTGFFLHYGPERRSTTVYAHVAVDLTRWHAFAAEWNATSVTGYVDGRRWFHTTRRAALPPGALGQAIQLDFVPGLRSGTARGVSTRTHATLKVDWIRMYPP